MKTKFYSSKKTLLSLLLSSGIFGALFSCCPDLPFWNIYELNRCLVYNYSDYQKTNYSNTVTTDTLVLNLNYQVQYLADVGFDFNPFINRSYATSCDDFNNGENGMKDDLVFLNVICNSHNASPGLNPSILMNDVARIQGQPLALWLANKSYNTFQQRGQYQSDLDIVITQRPPHGNHLDFEIKMGFQSGRILTIQSDIFRWQNNQALQSVRTTL